MDISIHKRKKLYLFFLKLRNKLALKQKFEKDTRLKKILIHLSVWIAYFFYENGSVLAISPSSVFITSSFLYFILNAVIFYLHVGFLTINNRENFRTVWVIIFYLLLLLIYLTSNFYLTIFIKHVGIETVMISSPLKDFIILRLFRLLYLITMSYTYWLIIYKINNEKKLFQIERERIEQLERTTMLENSNLNAELNYLKYQINPHFLFNTLSFIYTRVIELSDEAAKSVLLLSDIMNYALLNNDVEGKIELNQELEHLKNLIEINQLRYNKNLHIFLDLPPSEELAEIKIPQLTIVTFLENVFKYGDLSDKDQPAEIRITITNDFFRFYIFNKKSTAIRHKIQNGIGIVNVKKRLDLLYSKNDYNLIIDDEPLTFSVTLYLRIQPC